MLYGASSGGSGTEAMLAKQQQHLSAEDATAATADQALASFIIIQAALKRSAKLKEYCQRWVRGAPGRRPLEMPPAHLPLRSNGAPPQAAA